MSRMNGLLDELAKLGAVPAPKRAPAPTPARESAPEPVPDLPEQPDTAEAEDTIAALTEGFREEEPEPDESALEPEEASEESEDEPEEDEESEPEPVEEAAEEPDDEEDSPREALAVLRSRLDTLENAIADVREQMSAVRRLLK